MTYELVLQGEGARLALSVAGRENPTGVGSDAEWIACDAHLEVPGFGSGATAFSMTVSDLRRLARLCDGLLAQAPGRCSFEIEEENLAIELELDMRGALKVRCTLRQMATAPTQMGVEYVSDRGSLDQFARAVSNAAGALDDDSSRR